MSLAWPPAGAPVADGPALHAFIVGVSDYPHLEDNPGTAARAHDTLGLGQVTTPHYTAMAIVDWLLARFKHPTLVLGSIELLQSTRSESKLADGTMITADNATLANFKSAFRAWRKRCDACPGNLALFYFCGHGLHATDQLLLMEDFGDPVLDAWENCVNFSQMRTGMRSAAVQDQLYFIDACREAPLALMTTLHANGYVPIRADVDATVNCSAAYYATSHGKHAYGPRDGVSYFGQAVIACLEGGGAGQRNGTWLVSSYQLGAALGQFMGMLKRQHGKRLSCHADVSGDEVFINQVDNGTVLAIVTCRNDSASAVADIILRNGAMQFHSPAGTAKPLRQQVHPGPWQISVCFPGGQYPDAPTCTYFLMPPLFEGVPVP